MPVELISSGCHMENLGRYWVTKRRQAAHFSQQGHEAVAIVHIQLAIFVVQLHETTIGLQASSQGQGRLKVILSVRPLLCNEIDIFFKGIMKCEFVSTTHHGFQQK